MILTGIAKGETKNDINIPKATAGFYVREIAPFAFQNNQFIKAVNIANTVQKIGQSSFDGCSDLLYLFMETSPSVVEIEKRAFRSCSKLTGITCLSPISIDEEVFTNCSNIRTVDIRATEIGKKAFSRCSLLHHVSLHLMVEIAPDAFEQCEKLSNLYIMDDVKGSLDFIKNLTTETKVHCRPNSRVAELIYDGYKIVADLD